MYEDQIAPIKDTAVPATPDVPVTPTAPADSIEGLVDPTHKIPVIPPDQSHVLQPVVPPIHNIDGETPPPLNTITGNLITFPGRLTRDNVGKISEGKANDGDADAARVVDRQIKRAA